MGRVRRGSFMCQTSGWAGAAGCVGCTAGAGCGADGKGEGGGAGVVGRPGGIWAGAVSRQSVRVIAPADIGASSRAGARGSAPPRSRSLPWAENNRCIDKIGRAGPALERSWPPAPFASSGGGNGDEGRVPVPRAVSFSGCGGARPPVRHGPPPLGGQARAAQAIVFVILAPEPTPGPPVRHTPPGAPERTPGSTDRRQGNR